MPSINRDKGGFVVFSGASWELWASDEDGYGHLESSGKIINDLTVTIIKTT